MSAVSDLPLPNRDTLSYMMAHWQRVAQAAHLNKMPVENLARVLAPTVIGYAGGEGMAEQSPRIERTLLALLRLPAEYWTGQLEYGAQMLICSPRKSVQGTPGGTPSPPSSLQSSTRCSAR